MGSLRSSLLGWASTWAFLLLLNWSFGKFLWCTLETVKVKNILARNLDLFVKNDENGERSRVRDPPKTRKMGLCVMNNTFAGHNALFFSLSNATSRVFLGLYGVGL